MKHDAVQFELKNLSTRTKLKMEEHNQQDQEQAAGHPVGQPMGIAAAADIVGGPQVPQVGPLAAQVPWVDDTNIEAMMSAFAADRNSHNFRNLLIVSADHYYIYLVAMYAYNVCI